MTRPTQRAEVVHVKHFASLRKRRPVIYLQPSTLAAQLTPITVSFEYL